MRIVEVGPRDGLQNEPTVVPTDVKVEFINKLSDTGLKCIEVTSFVSPKWIPQTADNAEVFKRIEKKPGVSYPVLIPNLKGLEAAVSSTIDRWRSRAQFVLTFRNLKIFQLAAGGVEEIAVFASASDGFSMKNVNCTAEEGIRKISEVTEAAKRHNLRVRGYISCIVACPYDGPVKPSAVAKVADSLLNLGCYEISLGDTIGVGTKDTITAMLHEVFKVAKPEKFAIHCHDTYGQALVNTCVALDKGIKVVDSSVAGLGGCPYAAGATGNVASEDLVYMLHGMGVETGVDLEKLVHAGRFIMNALKKQPVSKVNNAMFKKYNL